MKHPSKKNSLTAFKKAGQGILPTDTPAAANDAPAAKKRGAKPKAATERRTHRVMVSLTDAERDKLAEKRGYAGEATYIYAFLKENGLFD